MSVQLNRRTALKGVGCAMGLPLLEAMHHGCLCLSTICGASPEVSGDAAVNVNPYDFSDVVRGLGAVPRRAGPADLERAFASLAAGARPVLAVGPTGLTRAWRAKSLLGAFAAMAWLDLTGGGRVADCDECGRPYVSGAYQARYCSDRCRNRALKRAFRERHRDREVAADVERTSA